MEIRKTLPEQAVPESVRQRAGTPRLRIDGLVERPQELVPEQLAGLARDSFTESFKCEEGWEVPGLAWEGYRLRDVLALAGVRARARFVRVGSGEYVVPISLEDAERALLCDRLNGAPLPERNGAPWRLSVPGAVCFASVKWVDRLTLTTEAGENTGQAIARSRKKTGG
ncbi:MAG TPA: molybdopterin-dependent oxidoreductase [Pelomicrobium sp.]|nr:molybdopterin-dependent oxidoreductase [Pelomicrobium sp.]